MFKNFSEARQETVGGRSYDKGDRGRKLRFETYMFDRGDHVALRHYSTDIALFYPDFVELGTCVDSKTTVERLRYYTPLNVHTVCDATVRQYRCSYRVILADGAPMMLDYKPGVRVTYDGKWIPRNDCRDKIDLSLPPAGTRKRINARVKQLRTLLKPHVNMLWDTRPENGVVHVSDARHITEDFIRGNELDADDTDRLVDFVVQRQFVANTPTGALQQLISGQEFLRYTHKVGSVPADEAKALLLTRGPEWPEGKTDIYA